MLLNDFGCEVGKLNSNFFSQAIQFRQLEVEDVGELL